MSITSKIKPKITKVINKFPTNVDIYRDILNEFNEVEGNSLVCNITGFYHEGNNMITTIVADKGEVKKINQVYLMVIYDETSNQIKEDDYFYLDNIKYVIKDKGNSNRLNIYYDMLLEVI